MHCKSLQNLGIWGFHPSTARCHRCPLLPLSSCFWVFGDFIRPPLSITSTLLPHAIQPGFYSNEWQCADHLTKTVLLYVHEDTCHAYFTLIKPSIPGCTQPSLPPTSTMPRLSETLLVAFILLPWLLVNGLDGLTPAFDYKPAPRNAVIRGLLVSRQGVCSAGFVGCEATGCCPTGWNCCSGSSFPPTVLFFFQVPLLT